MDRPCFVHGLYSPPLVLILLKWVREGGLRRREGWSDDVREGPGQGRARGREHVRKGRSEAERGGREPGL